MCDEFEPPIPVTRLIGHSGFGDSIGPVEASASNYIQEKSSLGGFLMRNDSAVCGGRVRLKISVRVWSYMWKSLQRYSAMMFSVTLMCC